MLLGDRHTPRYSRQSGRDLRRPWADRDDLLRQEVTSMGHRAEVDPHHLFISEGDRPERFYFGTVYVTSLSIVERVGRNLIQAVVSAQVVELGFGQIRHRQSQLRTWQTRVGPNLGLCQCSWTWTARHLSGPDRRVPQDASETQKEQARTRSARLRAAVSKCGTLVRCGDPGRRFPAVATPSPSSASSLRTRRDHRGRPSSI